MPRRFARRLVSYQLEICSAQILGWRIVYFEDLEFKIIYVGSAETYEFDQVLDQIVVDAVPQGQFKFMFQVSLGFHLEIWGKEYKKIFEN